MKNLSIHAVRFILASFALFPTFTTLYAQQGASSSPESASSIFAGPTHTPTSVPSPTPPAVCVPQDCRGENVSSRFDVDGNCQVNLTDLNLVVQAAAGGIGAVPGIQPDVNDDGRVNNQDVGAIQAILSRNGCWVPPTPTPTPTPVPTPVPCVYAVGFASWSHLRDDTGYSVLNMMDRLQFTRGSAGLPACFTNHFQSLSFGYRMIGGQNYDWFTRTMSHRIRIEGGLNASDVSRFAIWGMTLQVGAHTVAQFLGVPPHLIPPFRLHDASHLWFMDANCRYTTLIANQPICGMGGISFSPISLILGEKDSFERNSSTVVPFSLSPNKEKRYSLWRGSAEAPLLVVDPAHSGVITSPEQLFGNYTFGGKESISGHTPVSLATKQGANQALPWDNGFDALASLDLNKDSEISGTELHNLGLWFDENKNGVSEKGEVRSLKSEGITKLFFRNYKVLPDTQDLILEVGYERVDGSGRTSHGRAVDWFAEVFSSKQEAIAALSVAGSPSQSIDKKRGDTVAPEPQTFSTESSSKRTSADPAHFAPKLVAEHAINISGYWAWALLDKDGDKNPGFFALTQTDDGTVEGFSIIESQLGSTNPSSRRALSFLPLKGSIQKNEGGELEFSYRIFEKNGEGFASGTAYLSPDGTMLAGNTNQSFVVQGKSPRAVAVEYSWVANKLLAGDSEKRGG
jgi:hypothetical protein